MMWCEMNTENKGVGVMKPGHSFTIEPMINEGQLRSALSTACSDVNMYYVFT